MFSPADNPATARPRRFGLREALLVVGILAFGGFALISDGRMTPEDLFAGVTETIGR